MRKEIGQLEELLLRLTSHELELANTIKQRYEAALVDNIKAEESFWAAKSAKSNDLGEKYKAFGVSQDALLVALEDVRACLEHYDNK